MIVLVVEVVVATGIGTGKAREELGVEEEIVVLLTLIPRLVAEDAGDKLTLGCSAKGPIRSARRLAFTQ